MLTDEQALKLLRDFARISIRTMSGQPEDLAALEESLRHIVTLLTGSSRTECKTVDPNTETQLCESIPGKKPTERDRVLNIGFQNLFDELIVRQQRMHEVLVRYIGCDADQLVLRSRDLLHMTVDLGTLMLAMGGSWAEVVSRIESDEKDRRERTKFATRSMEDEAKPLITTKQAKPEVDASPEAAKG